MIMLCFAVFQRCDRITAVLFSHLNRDQAREEVERINLECRKRGIPLYSAHAWIEEHPPEKVFTLGSCHLCTI